MSSSIAVVKVNTFFKVKSDKPFIDGISKSYIVLESVLGLGRVPIMCTRMTRFAASITILYSILVLVAIMYSTFRFYEFSIIINFGIIEFVFCVILGCLTWKRIERYYNELSKFDAEFGCRPSLSVASVKNMAFMIFFTIALTIFHIVCHLYERFDNVYLTFIPMNIIHSMEMYYYGHLLSLLIPKLRLINYYVESSLSSRKNVPRPKIKEFSSFKYKDSTNNEINKLMDMYHVVIKSYDYLVDAIKWQLLVVLITSFCITLFFCHHLSLNIIRNQDPFLNILSDMGMTVAEMLPLFSPCMFGDRVHNEVRRLRELLASRLYENKLEKPGRSAARALLALTEARDLSFSLLRMLQIDISLPFKFIGLLVTYLIILLQFDKVIQSNPTVSTPTA